MKFVIWGSGKCGEKVYTLLGNDLIAAFIDSQTSKHGKYYLGKPILAFEEYRKSFADYEIIVALFSYEQAEQVVHMLSMYGITSYSAIVDLPFELLQLKDENLCVLLQKIPGTGKSFDWELLKNISRPYFLAGGLCCENISQAITALDPYAVDVSSGIETNGCKDKNKMAAFVAAVRKEI